MGLVTRASDTFTRADSTTTLGTAETGGAWTAHVGTWGISSNQAYCPTSAGLNIATVDTGYSDGFVTVTVTGVSAAGQRLVFRLSDSSNYWDLQAVTGSCLLQKYVAGSLTNVVNLGTTISSGDVLRVTTEDTRRMLAQVSHSH